MRLLFSIGVIVCCAVLATAQSGDSSAVSDSMMQTDIARIPEPMELMFTGKDLPSTYRVATYLEESPVKNRYFYGAVIMSFLIVLLFISSKEIVFASWRSFFRLQYQIQYGRTDKSNNLIYLLLYTIVFILSASVLIYYSLQTFLYTELSIGFIALTCLGYFVWDYYSSNMFYLFAGGRKTIEMIKYINLSYAPIWSLMAWLGLFFVLLANPTVGRWFSFGMFAILLLSILVKELRVLQVLWSEKVEVISFHFFAYLCTFKFLPFALLIWLLY